VNNPPPSFGPDLAALLHELNQPLTAILSNAQAAQRFLASRTLDRAELRHILEDIVADDQRAAGIMKRLAEALRAGRAPAMLDFQHGAKK
jgi:two-component system, LuxR family, sensor kinase FixL